VYNANLFLLLCTHLQLFVCFWVRTMFLDRDWFSLETASTLIANHSGQLHAPLPVQAPAAETTPTEPVQEQQQQQQGKQQGKQKGKQQKQRQQSPPPVSAVPLSAIEIAAATLSGMLLILLTSLKTKIWWFCF